MMVQHLESMWQLTTHDLEAEKVLSETLSPQRRQTVKRDQLTAELLRLERLQEMASHLPDVWRRVAQPRQHELALWLFTVAVGVAALGFQIDALAILDVLPGIHGGGQGRRELLEELLQTSEPKQKAM